MPTPTTREPVTRARIGQVALEVIDAEGTRAVTMRRIAAVLGVQAPSLYAHVRGRDEILQLAHAQAMTEVGPFSSSGDWRDDLRTYYRRMHDVLLAHGDVATVQFGSVPLTEESLQGFESAIRALADSGLEPRLAARATERLSLYVTADAYEQWEFAQRSSGPPPESVMRELAPGLVDFLDGNTDLGAEGPFEFGLDLLIAGIDRVSTAT
ncbi:TetR family transcriptional regulator [Epidermidibacterium keratini]|uniref:TetR family transcriptional regulator n=1 Tax=Epidermidibacterium keratini TaxID=1891644 RepID=A0A7L4YMK9_9ACTN|nr:TetR/AcrR family transcriptional regulator C-terminal domain-containing protein [Epidermidibacterium keratini]QHC00380.1 TetR family transcriptional regulator [Epidermidibacterium keratini]